MKYFLGLFLIRFYDLNGDGCITKREMLVIITAIYEMVRLDAHTIQPAINIQVDRFFEKMDTDRDGIVTREEFMSGCKNVRATVVSVPRCDNDSVLMTGTP